MPDRQKVDASLRPDPGQGLGMMDCVLLAAGGMIGTGIFLIPGSVAEALPSTLWILVAWSLGGLFALAGALCYAELGAMFPRAGGHYVYMREAYGPFWGFIDGWLSIAVVFPCSIAFMAVGLSRYLAGYVPFFAEGNELMVLNAGAISLSLRGEHIPALFVIAVLTLLNGLGLKAGARTQNLLSMLKLACLVGLIAAGFLCAPAIPDPVPVAAAGSLSVAALLLGMGTALLGISFSYLGWDVATYMAAETHQPQHVLPRSLALATIGVTVVYLLFNFSLLQVLSPHELAGASNAVQAAALKLGYAPLAGILSAIVILAILSATQATIMVGPRVTYAMARDGLFFASLGRVNPRSKVPCAAIVAQGVWTCIIVVTGTFSGILTYSVFATLLLSLATGAAVLVLRKRKPDMPRPFRTWGYPWVPLFYIIGSLAIVLVTLVNSPRESASSFAAVLVGALLYRWLFNVRPRGV